MMMDEVAWHIGDDLATWKFLIRAEEERSPTWMEYHTAIIALQSVARRLRIEEMVNKVYLERLGEILRRGQLEQSQLELVEM